MNKYNAVKTWSELCQRTFDSKGEAQRAEELYLLQKAGYLKGLEFQLLFVLSEDPRVTVSIDFGYYDCEKNKYIYEDFKGVLTRDSRTKYAWLKQRFGIQIKLTR